MIRKIYNWLFKNRIAAELKKQDDDLIQDMTSYLDNQWHGTRRCSVRLPLSIEPVFKKIEPEVFDAVFTTLDKSDNYFDMDACIHKPFNKKTVKNKVIITKGKKKRK